MKRKSLCHVTKVILAVLTFSCLSACGSKSTAPESQETVASTSAPAVGFGRSSAMTEELSLASNDVSYDSAEVLTSGISVQNISTSHKLIRNAYLHVETTGFNILLDEIRQAIMEMGGYIEQSDITGNSTSYSDRRYAYLVARVPSEKLDQFISQVEAQGNITSKSESTQDVTLQYSDLESRKKSLTVEQDRLWALLEKADTLEAVIALEARLSEIRYQLESFETQLRLYDNQIDYSTVTLNISEVQVFTPTSPDSVLTRIQKGFSRSLNSVSQGLINSFVWFVSNIPVLTLWIVILGGLFLIYRKTIWKGVGKKRKNPMKNKESSTPKENQ